MIGSTRAGLALIFCGCLALGGMAGCIGGGGGGGGYYDGGYNTGGDTGGGGGGTDSGGGGGTDSGGGGGTDSGGGGGGGNFSSSVDGNKQLGQLSSTEKTTLCNETKTYVYSYIPESQFQNFMCTFQGLLVAAFGNPSTDSELQTNCASARDQCMSDPPDMSASCDIPSGCTATVSEMETCIAAYGPALKDADDELPACEQATLEDANNSGSSVELPPAACDTVEQKCPEMFSSGSGSGG